MYYLLIKRFDDNENNSSNRWSVNGPFGDRSNAENMASQALGTQTCVSVQILDKDQIVALSKAHCNDLPDVYLMKALQVANYLFS